LLLALVQLALNAPFLVLPPGLAIVLIATAAIEVVGVAALIAFLLRWSPVRAPRSALVGGVLASLVVTASSGPVLASTELAWPFLVLGGLSLVVAISFAGTWLVRASERGRPASAMLTWTGAVLVLAAVVQLVSSRAGWWVYAAIAAGLGVTLVGLLGNPIRGRAQPRAHFGFPCLALLAAAAVAPFWPWWLPWLLSDRELPEVSAWPPNFLIVVLEAPASGPPELLELLASEAIVYERLYPDPEPLSLLTLPGGGSLVSQLRDYGYVTSAVAARRGAGLDAEFAEIDDRPGGSRLLAESGSWMAGAELLLGPASGLVAQLGYDRPLRTPQELGSAAALWLQDWRLSRARRPFQLLVDFREPDASGEAIGAGLESILESLRQHLVDDNTLLAIAIESRAPAAGLRALVVPPYSWQPPVTREVVTAPVWGRGLSRSLLQIALSDGVQPLRFSGLDRELSPPELR